MLAARCRVPGRALMLVERVERQCGAHLGMQLVRERDDERLRGWNRLDVRELLAFEQVVPRKRGGGHSSSTVKSVSGTSVMRDTVPLGNRGALAG